MIKKVLDTLHAFCGGVAIEQLRAGAVFAPLASGQELQRGATVQVLPIAWRCVLDSGVANLSARRHSFLRLPEVGKGRWGSFQVG